MRSLLHVLAVAALAVAAAFCESCAQLSNDEAGSRPPIATSAQAVVGDPTCTPERYAGGRCDIILVATHDECGSGGGCTSARMFRDSSPDDMGPTPHIYERGFVPGTTLTTSRIWMRDVLDAWDRACRGSYRGREYPRCTLHGVYDSSDGHAVMMLRMTGRVDSGDPPKVVAWSLTGTRQQLNAYAVAYDPVELTYGQSVSARLMLLTFLPAESNPYDHIFNFLPDVNGQKLAATFPTWRMR